MSPENNKPVIISQKLFLQFLKLFPKEHILEFGQEMNTVFAEDCAEVYRHSGLIGLIKLWLITLGDLLINMGYEHTRVWKQKMNKEHFSMEEKQLTTQQYILNGLYWALGGMAGGVVLGLMFLMIYGLSLLSVAVWISFSLFVGALAGAVSFIIYSAIYNLVLRKAPPLKI